MQLKVNQPELQTLISSTIHSTISDHQKINQIILQCFLYPLNIKKFQLTKLNEQANNVQTIYSNFVLKNQELKESLEEIQNYLEGQNSTSSIEGFYSHESPQDQKYKKSSLMVQKKNSHLQNEKKTDIIQETQKSQQQELIYKLKQQLKEQQEQMLIQTVGYMKDIQNMKEQLFRKQTFNFIDVFEVKYFNDDDIPDIRYREMMNARLSEIKIQFDKIFKGLLTKIRNLELYIDELNVNYEEYESKIEELNNPFFLAKKLMSVLPDPYNVWKLISDVQGTHFFMPVFFKPNLNIGIDYNVIHQIMNTDEGFKREYSIYKQTLDDQVIVLVKQLNAATEDQIKEKQNSIDQVQALRNRHEEEKQLLKEEMYQRIDEIHSYYKEIYKQKEVEQEKFIYNLKLSYMIKLWSLFSKKFCQNLVDKILVKQTLINEAFYNELKSYHFLELSHVENDLKNQKYLLQQQIVSNIQNEQQLYFFSNIAVKLEDELNSVKQQLRSEQQSFSLALNKAKITEHCAQLILGIVEGKKNLTSFSDEDKSPQALQKFMNKVEQIKEKQRKMIEIAIDQHQKSKYIQDNIMDIKAVQEKEVLTDIFNINKEFAFNAKQHSLKKVLKLHELPNKKQKKNNSLQPVFKIKVKQQNQSIKQNVEDSELVPEQESLEYQQSNIIENEFEKENEQLQEELELLNLKNDELKQQIQELTKKLDQTNQSSIKQPQKISSPIQKSRRSSMQTSIPQSKISNDNNIQRKVFKQDKDINKIEVSDINIIKQNEPSVDKIEEKVLMKNIQSYIEKENKSTQTDKDSYINYLKFLNTLEPSYDRAKSVNSTNWHQSVQLTKTSKTQKQNEFKNPYYQRAVTPDVTQNFKQMDQATYCQTKQNYLENIQDSFRRKIQMKPIKMNVLRKEEQNNTNNGDIFLPDSLRQKIVLQ